MRRTLLIAGWLLTAASAAVILACAERAQQSPRAGASGAGAATPARVQRVVDGDTLKVRLHDGRRRTVRLIGIDTPETKKPGDPVQCGGPQASNAMRRLVLRGDGERARGRDVVLAGDPSQDAEDRFGRWLAYVEVAGRDVGRELIRSGWAQAVAFDGAYRRQPAYEVAEASARLRGLGIWRLCDVRRR